MHNDFWQLHHTYDQEMLILYQFHRLVSRANNFAFAGLKEISLNEVDRELIINGFQQGFGTHLYKQRVYATRDIELVIWSLREVQEENADLYRKQKTDIFV